MSVKRCPICGEVKSLDEFDKYFSKDRNKYRPQNYCKICQPVNANERTKMHYQKHKEKKLQYGRVYRQNPDNQQKLKKSSQHFKRKYREELQPCYVRDLLNQKDRIPTELSRAIPEIVTAKILQIKIKRKIKQLKDAKK